MAFFVFKALCVYRRDFQKMTSGSFPHTPNLYLFPSRSVAKFVPDMSTPSLKTKGSIGSEVSIEDDA